MANIQLNATDQYLLEVAIESASAHLSSLASLHERNADAQVAESIRLSLNSIAAAREVMARAGSSIRELPSSRARDLGLDAVSRGFETPRPRDLDMPTIRDVTVAATDQHSSTEEGV